MKTLRRRALCLCFFLLSSAWIFSQGSAEAEPEPSADVSLPESPAAAAAYSASPEIKIPESVVQGDVLAVLARLPLPALDQALSGSGPVSAAAAFPAIRDVSAELTDSAGKKVLSFMGFRYLLPGAADNWAALGGISSVQQPGDYSLTVSVSCDDGRLFTFRENVKITARRFVREDIPLNEAMSALREDPDPRKAAEARELWALLAKVNLTAVYHAGKLSSPTTEVFRETSFFGDRRTFLYTDGGKANSIHYGIDYATPRGTPVLATATGKVVMAKERVLTGFSIVIEHLPGVYSLYYHMDKLDVQEGQMVAAGDIIGASGFTGLSTGPHLHWEIRVAGNAVEPKTLLELPFIPAGF
ncbi:MAG: M23 family metallopeptidase [Spirochaetaceae bacterium]|nr:M23 family metallopeptidase [Spirochaetaceae bacterium]